MNLHHDGVRPTAFAQSTALTTFFDLIATNRDRVGAEFVSMIAGKQEPIYGAQWHAERNQVRRGAWPWRGRGAMVGILASGEP